ncbi:hypothetical protein EVAR_85842_1 [Eumeta japonica]|uniref:Uncharacterized protein n=1 Tax=Eumeta variegata TaxID=151549 RepID=A0A4C1UQA2_EUMVA|nr:hypothetical protein EVAR_85842_1 [Eumeta japonica]
MQAADTRRGADAAAGDGARRSRYVNRRTEMPAESRIGRQVVPEPAGVVHPAPPAPPPDTAPHKNHRAIYLIDKLINTGGDTSRVVKGSVFIHEYFESIEVRRPLVLLAKDQTSRRVRCVPNELAGAGGFFARDSESYAETLTERPSTNFTGGLS